MINHLFIKLIYNLLTVDHRNVQVFLKFMVDEWLIRLVNQNVQLCASSRTKLSFSILLLLLFVLE